MGELMGEFDQSKGEGQAKWKKTREAVLPRRAEAEAYAKAEQVEAEVVVKNYTELRNGSAPLVAEWALRSYGQHRHCDAS